MHCMHETNICMHICVGTTMYIHLTYVSMYVCMYVCMYIYIYICIHAAYVYVFAHVFAYGIDMYS